ncbi:MAG TPA: hypothetical protein VGL56_08160 [Fimbriimonadaceae bacterium]|jgi:hypothetical protein
MYVKRAIISIAALCLLGVLSGCSGGVSSTADVHVSKEDMTKSQVFRANEFLDNIEKLPADQRQIAASMPAASAAIYDASQTDPATAKRIQGLGITVKAPAKAGLGGHRPGRP